jgi:hippurate hydrolase
VERPRRRGARSPRQGPGLTELLDAAGELLDETVELRRRLHRHPELGLELPKTQEAVLDALDGLPLSITTGTSTTSVVATLDGDRDGPTILLRGDMDALPMPEDTGLEYASTVDGTMHACGHDAHTAMLVGAAKLLTARRADLAGRVVFMFQPGEEGFAGARYMLEEGLLDAQPSAAFAIHQTPNLPSGMVAAKGGPMMASSDVLEITITAQGGHASMPHLAVDPVPIACEIVTAIHAMVTRGIDVFDPAVVTIGKISAGTTSNVIPESAYLLGTVRAVSERTRRSVWDKLRRLADGIASAHGASAECVITEGYPVTVNHDDWVDTSLAVADRTLGEGKSIKMPAPVMGAEDFSYVLQSVPGAMVFLGTDPGRGHAAPNHSNRMVIDETAMASGVALYAGMALEHCRQV